MLGKTIQNFSVSQYNWLYLSVWLGLRPNEVDKLIDDEFVRILFDKQGIPILWVYQSKLTSIPPRFRWKLIPLFERPLAKTVKKYLGSNITLYGGRKGFTDLMLSINQRLENISQWMGHSTIDRTWKHYKCRTMVHYDKKAA
jgi:integrase